MESKSIKRQRSENWLEEDKIILKELVKERVSVIENKNTDANTNAKKVEAWHDLRTSFNNMAKTPRTLQQIKAQWGIIKMAAKKRKFVERRERFRTGGGPPPPSESPSGDDIAVWLPHEFTVDSNQFDSDNQTLKEIEKQKVEVTKEPKLSSPILCNSGVGITDMTLEPYTALEDNLCSSKQPEPSTSSIKPKSKTPHYRSRNKKISNITKQSAAQQIAETETACRKELHEAQMANEKQKLNNLKLKEEVLKYKLQYYKNKLN